MPQEIVRLLRDPSSTTQHLPASSLIFSYVKQPTLAFHWLDHHVRKTNGKQLPREQQPVYGQLVDQWLDRVWLSSMSMYNVTSLNCIYLYVFGSYFRCSQNMVILSAVRMTGKQFVFGLVVVIVEYHHHHLSRDNRHRFRYALTIYIYTHMPLLHLQQKTQNKLQSHFVTITI